MNLNFCTSIKLDLVSTVSADKLENLPTKYFQGDSTKYNILN